MAETSAWMPLYIGDYTADTMHLDGPKHGAYILLIIHYWRAGPLPEDDESLAIIARTDLKEWKKRIGPVIRQFFRSEDGKLRHKRIDNELLNAQANIDQRRAAGLASAAKRAAQREGNETPNESPTTVGTSDATDGSTGGQRNGRPSPSPKESKKDSDLRSAPETARDRLWREGPPIVEALIGKSNTQARTFLGGLLKRAGDDCAAVLRTLHEASDLRPIDPAAWLTKAVSGGDRRQLSAAELLAEEQSKPSPSNPTGRRISPLSGFA